MEIGRNLSGTCFDKSRECGMEVIKNNYIADKFYKKNGFSYLKEASTQSVYLTKKL